MEQFFTEFDAGTEGAEQRSKKVKWVCSDMWKPYLNVIERVCTKAKNVLDRFHIKRHLTNAVNETRKSDVRKLRSEGREAVLSKSKYIFLKNPENLTSDQSSKLSELSELLQYNLRVIRSYLMKEDFERFWEYRRGVSKKSRYLRKSGGREPPGLERVGLGLTGGAPAPRS